MVSSQRPGRNPGSLQARSRGHCMMEVAVLLLLLYLPVTVAVGVRHAQRSQTDSLSLVNSVQKTEEFATVDTRRESRSTATESRAAVMTHPAVPALLKNILSESVKQRSRRAVQKGCQFGTCQVHNLANTLYVMGQTNGKEQSKKAADPNGYGR